MAYRIRVTVDYDWVPDGTGSAMIAGGAISNMPGYGAADGPGMVQAAQTLQLRVAEQVAGGNSPTQTNFTNAMNQAVTDLVTKMGTAGAYSGGNQTPLALIQGWATGGA